MPQTPIFHKSRSAKSRVFLRARRKKSPAKRRGSVWQVTAQSNGAAFMRPCGPSDEVMTSTDVVLAM